MAAEYDGFADFPDRPWNVLAVANAIAGEILTHVPSMFTTLSTVPAKNVTVTTNALGGVTTRYFVPAAHLPLVQLFPALKSQEASLRKTVDSGYVRNDSKAAGAVASVAANSAVSATPAAVAPATVTNVAPATVTAPVSPATAAAAVIPVTRTDAPKPAATTPVDPTGGSNPPAVTPLTDRASASDTTEAPHPSAHRGAATPRSDRSDDVRSQTAKPAAAARTASRRSASAG